MAIWQLLTRACTPGPSALLAEEKFLRVVINQHDLCLVWTVECEKTIRLPSGLHFEGPRPLISGAFELSETGPVGSMVMRGFVPRQKPPWIS